MKRILSYLITLIFYLPIQSLAQPIICTITAPENAIHGGQYTVCNGTYLELPNLPDITPTPIAYMWTISSTTSSNSTFSPFTNQIMTSSDNGKWIQLKVVGADSSIGYSNKLKFYVKNSSSANNNVTACDHYTWHGVSYGITTSTPTFDTVNSFGCQHTIHLNLTINHSTNQTETVETCDSYNWHGTTYTYSDSSGIWVGTNAANCPDTHRLNLTLHYSNLTGTETANNCDSYNWHGTSYTSSGLYPYNTHTTHGCDSTVTLNLTIYYSNTTATQTVDVCDSYTWNGQDYTSSGSYPYPTHTVHGCDSLCTLILTIRNSSEATDVHAECGHLTWIDGIRYEHDTLGPTYVLQNDAGCDSIVTLHLVMLGGERPSVRQLVVKNLGSGSPKMLLFPRSANEEQYSYQWMKDDEPIANARLQYYQFSDADKGSHTFSVYTAPVDQHQCGSTSSVSLTVKAKEKTVLSVAPNPSDGPIEVCLLSQEEMDIVQIYSNTGVKVAEINVGGNHLVLDEHLPTGIYTLVVTTSTGSNYSHKLVIK